MALRVGLSSMRVVRRTAGPVLAASTSFGRVPVNNTFVPVRFGGHVPAKEQERPLPPLRQIATFSAEEVEDLFTRFKSYTANQSCMVPKGNFAPFLEPLHIEGTETNVDHYYKRFGKDDNTICLREFVTAVASCVPGSQERMSEIQFEAWDANNDGKINEEDYLKLLPLANPTKMSEGQVRSVGKELFHVLDNKNQGEIELNDFKRGIYMSQSQLGSTFTARGGASSVRASAKTPLIRWARWGFWDYFYVFTGGFIALTPFYAY